MPAPSLVKLDFQEKVIQSGRKENTEAVLKRIKVSIPLEEEERNWYWWVDITSEISCIGAGDYWYILFESCL